MYLWNTLQTSLRLWGRSCCHLEYAVRIHETRRGTCDSDETEVSSRCGPILGLETRVLLGGSLGRLRTAGSGSSSSPFEGAEGTANMPCSDSEL